MSNTCESAYPGTTIRADAFVPKESQLWFYLLFVSTKTNRDCSTRSCKPCFLRVRQVTLASARGITVPAAFSCHAFHCLETASRKNSFSRPFKPSHCFSLDRAASARNASCTNSDTLTRAFCGGELVVLGTQLLSGSAHGCCPLPQGR